MFAISVLAAVCL